MRVWALLADDLSLPGWERSNSYAWPAQAPLPNFATFMLDKVLDDVSARDKAYLADYVGLQSSDIAAETPAKGPPESGFINPAEGRVVLFTEANVALGLAASLSQENRASKRARTRRQEKD